MKAAYFHALRSAARPLSGFAAPNTPEEVGCVLWDVLALNREGCRRILDRRLPCRCGILLLPGSGSGSLGQLIQARSVVSVGFSLRDTITFSSLRDSGGVACLQRTLLFPDGSSLDPQEFLLPASPLPPEEQLLLLGLRLLTTSPPLDTA